MFPLTSLGRTAWVGIAALVTLLMAYSKGRMDGGAAVNEEWAAQRLSAAAAVQQQTERARAAERTAAQDITKTRERADAAINDLNARHARALDRLRRQTSDRGANLPDRPAAQPSDCSATSVPPGDGGLDVAREEQADRDREWLLTMARDADVTRVALDACVSQYETAREVADGR